MMKKLNLLTLFTLGLFASGSASAESCLDDLSSDSGATAFLGCLREIQGAIDALDEENGALATKIEKLEAGPAIDVQAVAAELVASHPDALRGMPGENADFPEQIVVASTSPCDSLGKEWTSFREATGRFIVGAGQDTLRAYRQWQPDGGGLPIALSDYEVLSIGGEEEHKLSEDEMPRHTHKVFLSNSAGAGVGIDRANNNANGGAANSERIERSGEGGAHNNLPPYIALYFCKKE